MRQKACIYNIKLILDEAESLKINFTDTESSYQGYKKILNQNIQNSKNTHMLDNLINLALYKLVD